MKHLQSCHGNKIMTAARGTSCIMALSENQLRNTNTNNITMNERKLQETSLNNANKPTVDVTEFRILCKKSNTNTFKQTNKLHISKCQQKRKTKTKTTRENQTC